MPLTDDQTRLPGPVLPQAFTAKKIAPVPRMKILPLPDPPFMSGKKYLNFLWKFRRRIRVLYLHEKRRGVGQGMNTFETGRDFFSRL